MLLQMLTIFFISMPQITYAFANNSEQLVNEKVLGHVLLEGISNFHQFFVVFKRATGLLFLTLENTAIKWSF